ncbi:MAG: hypothetical protein EDS66_07420 [Planctomycetota bacterium]|nr:MAG: hypothetical protein EDS66_07420 [Planctomycetota bacterium]KAB2948857.1 MAG: sulfatase [Phycisphaerae bacterium]MCQ3919677.1 hypothetical protein [Planctomycetota bacterium]
MPKGSRNRDRDTRTAATPATQPAAQANPSRNRRWIFLGAPAGLMLAVAAYLVLRDPPTPGGADAPPHPYEGPVRHVILISMDTTRADHFGCYGNAVVRTPAVDAVAAESVIFDDHMTVVPTTLPSHLTLMTGLYPHHHGVPSNGFVAHADNVTLAELLKSRGFQTAGFLGSFALDQRFGFAQGFDHFDQEFDILFGTNKAEQDERNAKSVTDAVIAYLDRVGVPPHLFLFVHYFDPHTPYNPPPPYDRMYDDADVAGTPPPDIGEVRKQLKTARGQETPNARRIANQYAGEVSYMDEHIGRLIADLRARGILDDAILILTSDHGDNFWEHAPYFDHGASTFQPTMRAVWIARLPAAQNAGVRLSAPTSSIDVLPTLLAYLNMKPPRPLPGRIIDLTSPQPAVGPALLFGEASEPWIRPAPGTWENSGKMRYVRDGRYKYVVAPAQKYEALFDLSVDPLERNNLLRDPTLDPATVDKYRRMLARWSQDAKPLPTHFDRGQRDAVVKRLQGLGYLSPTDDPDSDPEDGRDPDE